ncbi:MAG: TolC family protein [Spirochaetes bacterium]|nr:TolC family protein [Spirochaetota bacterium]
MKISSKRFREKYIIKISIISLILCLIPVINNSVSAENEKLSLKEAIDIALKNNNTYAISLEKVNESRIKVVETWGMLWPSLSTGVSYTRQDADAGYSSSVKSISSVTFVNGELYVNPGVFYNSLQSSRKGHVIAENEVRKVKLDTTIQTIRLYYSLLLAGESIKLREESAKALEENLRVVTIGYNKGTFSKLDFLRAKVAFSNEKTLLITAKNNYLSAKASLNIHLGRDINMPANLVGLSNIEISKDDLALLEIQEEKENEMLNRMTSESLKNRPELIQLKSTKEVQEYAAKAHESVYLWPTLFVKGSYGTTKNTYKEQEAAAAPPAGTLDAGDYYILSQLQRSGASSSPEGWNKSWNITVGATYKWGALAPVDSSHAKGKQARSQAKQTDLQLEDFIKNVRLDVQYNYLKYKSASNSIQSQQGNVETAEESLKVSITQFRSGIINNTELLDANVQLTTAKTLYIQALHDFQVAKAELNRAIGRDYFKIK